MYHYRADADHPHLRAIPTFPQSSVPYFGKCRCRIGDSISLKLADQVIQRLACQIDDSET